MLIRVLGISLSIWGAALAVHGQDEGEGEDEGGKSPLDALYESVAQARQVLSAKRAALAAATSEVEKADRAKDLLAAERNLAAKSAEFTEFVTGVDPRAFGVRTDDEFDWQRDIGSIFRPAMDEVMKALEEPREAERIRSDLEHFSRLRRDAGAAIEAIEQLRSAGGLSPGVEAELRDLLSEWEMRRTEATNRVSVLQHQVAENAHKKKSFFGVAADGLKSFVSSRGKNLLLVVASFFGTFFLLRLLGRYLIRVSPWHRREERHFYARLAVVVYYAFTTVGALLVATLVLYATGDWVLMGIGILFLVGLLLAAKSGLPKFYEQARILLNLGEVREGERVVVDGVPWEVATLSVFSTLKNPDLTGGTLRLPIRALPALRSRPYGRNEPWFPCSEGDWVTLSDDTRGRVISQTPERVELILLGGSRKTYSTADFLSATPNNISRNFRVRSVFGIDYRHQAICTAEVPAILEAKVGGYLNELMGEENIQRLKVEFREAGSSSLDYEIIADMKGDVADKYEVVQRALQRAAVDACNEHGWTIPFTQITLHQAESPATEGSK